MSDTPEELAKIFAVKLRQEGEENARAAEDERLKQERRWKDDAETSAVLKRAVDLLQPHKTAIDAAAHGDVFIIDQTFRDPPMNRFLEEVEFGFRPPGPAIFLSKDGGAIRRAWARRPTMHARTDLGPSLNPAEVNAHTIGGLVRTLVEAR
jgi:hypothetical protein